jgi:hypothetical protein
LAPVISAIAPTVIPACGLKKNGSVMPILYPADRRP